MLTFAQNKVFFGRRFLGQFIEVAASRVIRFEIDKVDEATRTERAATV